MAMLLPNSKQAYITAAGAPLSGGKLFTYAAGTTTPQTTWSDAAGTVPNANPVILDARGEASIFWNGTYKITLTDATGGIIWTQDNVATAGVSTVNLALTGIPTAPTAAPGTNTTQIATTAFVQGEKASPAFTGVPTAPTAAALTNTTQIATTAFVQASGAAGAPLASPAFTGTPTAPTAAAGTNTTQLATTAFVQGLARTTFPGNPSVSFTAADTDNNTHKVASGAGQTLTLGSITAGTSFTIRFTTAWALTCAGGLSKGGAAPGGVTTGAVAANSMIVFFTEGGGEWDASGAGLS